MRSAIKLEMAAGVELSGQCPQPFKGKGVSSKEGVGDSQIDSHELGSSCPDLSRIIKNWGLLSRLERRALAELVSALTNRRAHRKPKDI